MKYGPATIVGDLASLELALIPGLAFDLAGNRLGRGGGHYDRFLATLPPHTLTMGVAFDAQIGLPAISPVSTPVSAAAT